jgi:glycosyltransferase involved in cell wall biosynthesis
MSNMLQPGRTSPVTPPVTVSRRKLCFVATVPYAFNAFMKAHLEALGAEYDITLVTNGTAAELSALLERHVTFVPIAIERKVSVWRDLVALVDLWRLFLRERFDVVHSITPKAGMLAMLAARAAGVRFRIHTFTGQVWATQTGVRRLLLKAVDKSVVWNATRAFADSPSQRSFLIEQGVAKSAAIDVLGDGSVAGVSLDRFRFDAEARRRVRAEWIVSDEAILFLFLGRLTRDKGLVDLAAAFAALAEENAGVHLAVAGPDEEGLWAAFDAVSRRFPGRVHRVDFTARPEDYMSASDVLCLPSYREGFGSVIIYGIIDAVVDGKTGILHLPRATTEITGAMRYLAGSADVRRAMGDAARARVRERFGELRLTRAFAEFYREMLTSSAPR